MMELTACPPSAGKPSTKTTRRPRAAASSAAETPEMPAPRMQKSASTLRPDPARLTSLVSVEIFDDMIFPFPSALPPSRT